ncbi:hypothetical protein N431DRAFT_431045 [Stipitochalara longipes BDJ]|nr:hypothetical protein N431DRAFT_431045 [Stipitochalara longipes BDJ]
MVVVDVTKLDEVRYGIVGFAAWEMMFITSAAAELRLAAAHFFFLRGELRVMDELRPRSAMSAAEYRAKFKNNHTIRTYYNDNVSKQLARVPLIDEAAMDLVWPLGLDGEDEILPSLASLSVGVKVNRSLPDQAITSLIQSILDLENFNMSIFDHVRSIPNFQDLLRNNLVQHSARLCSTRSAGQLIRLAFADQEHLSLEQLKSLSAEAISAALGVRGMREVMSISLCIDSLRSTPAQLIDVLSRADNLREIYFLQNPIREGNALSVQLFEELAARSQILKRAKVILAGAFSAALHKRLWLPRIPIPRCMPSDISDVVQVAPLDVFPVQQMFVRYQIGDSIFKYKYVHLGDALLKPERFAAGFLLYLRSLVPSLDEGNKEAQLFSFSSAPSSLAADTLTSAEVSTIPAESFSSRKCAQCWPRDLVRGGWTVIVSQESHYPRRGSFYSIRYAFVRACQQRIMVDLPPLTPPSPDQLQVVGLKEFLGFTASEVDPDVVDCRLHAVAEHLVACEHQGTPGTRFPGIEPVSVLSHAEAADILLRFLFLNMLEK